MNFQILTTKGNKMHVKCNSFAVKDRVTFEGDDLDAWISPSDMPLHTFLPTQEDCDHLKQRMIIIVQRILREQAAMLKYTNVPNHFPHKYAEQSSIKSEYPTPSKMFFFPFHFNNHIGKWKALGGRHGRRKLVSVLLYYSTFEARRTNHLLKTGGQ